MWQQATVLNFLFYGIALDDILRYTTTITLFPTHWTTRIGPFLCLILMGLQIKLNYHKVKSRINLN